MFKILPDAKKMEACLAGIYDWNSLYYWQNFIGLLF
jgi:uncharacterized protein involved in tolerance to divalent cations